MLPPRFKGRANLSKTIMSSTRCVALVFATTCTQMTVVPSRGDEKLPVVDEAVINAFVAHLAENGITLTKDRSLPQANKPHGGYEAGQWTVTEPKSDGYEVTIYFKTFPSGTGEKEMHATLQSLSLSGMLCVPARLAMSKPGLRGAGMKKLPSPQMVPVAAKLEKLFNEYRPSQPMM